VNRPLGPGDDRPEPVAIVVGRAARPGRETEFENWGRRFLSTASAFPGHLAGSAIKQDGRAEYLFIHHFVDQEHLDRWMDSPERATLLAEEVDVAGSPHRTQNAAGLETWFRLPGEDTPASRPAAWKMSLLTVIVIYLLVLGYVEWAAPLFYSWPLLLSNLVLPVVLTTLLSYVILPLLTRVFRRWLFAGN
jgi:antibiotic biosynthesis monooxygenase (ABM) superfamily enzyme